ncbi:MAG: ABC transporter ATP-binding protein [Gammaproteobacteria bacterium]|nr:ABC transporter ATP-binding protein [Gammaproteobacteria bacterium]
MSYSAIQNVAFHKRITDVRRFSEYLLPYWDKQLVLFICMGFSVLFSLVQPYFARLLIDYALLGGDLHIFNTLLFAGILSYLFSIPIECIQKAAGFYLTTRVSLGLRSSFYRKLQLLSLRFSQSRSVGEHLYRLGTDLDSVLQLIVSTIPSALILLIRLALLLLVCFWIDYRLTLALLLVSPVIYGHTIYFTRLQKRISTLMITHTQGISSRLQQALAQMLLIKIFGREKREYVRFIGDTISLIRLNIRNLRLAIVRGESGRLLNASITGGITYFLGYQVIKAQLTLGQLTAISMYLFQLNDSIRAVGGLYNDFVIKFIALDRVVETLDASIEVQEVARPVRNWQKNGDLQLRNVSFAYRQGNSVLNSVSLHVSRGEKVLLTGDVGTGKSTLCHLLMRLYDPTAGTILLDGHDIRQLKLDTLRGAIGFAGSEPMLFQDTVKNNICFGSSVMELEEIIKVAEVAGIHGRILELPLGYDTFLETGEDRLSLGEKQSICLARALIKRPEILVLDEAFSSLDKNRVESIASNISKLYKDMTSLIITHHYINPDWLDRTVTLKDGIIEEAGPVSYKAEKLEGNGIR